jgi:Zn-dependent peptidase ImmA (M78 family)
MWAQSLDSVLNVQIEELTADEGIPVDVLRVASRIGAKVEEREMIPEAAMEVKNSRFHIYLQSNFKSSPGRTLRARFSLAHEIGRTLFYELMDELPKPRKDAPRGNRLEAACQRAAGNILVPSKALHAQIEQRQAWNAAALMELANRFEVSAEVMLRRLMILIHAIPTGLPCSHVASGRISRSNTPRIRLGSSHIYPSPREAPISYRGFAQ